SLLQHDAALKAHEPVPRSGSLAAIAIGLDSESRWFLQACAESFPLLQLLQHIDGHAVADPAAALPKALADAPDVCLIDFDANPRGGPQLAARIHAHSPDTAIFAVSSRSEPGCIVDAMRSGCTEYLLKPLAQEQLMAALQRVASARKERKDRAN